MKFVITFQINTQVTIIEKFLLFGSGCWDGVSYGDGRGSGNGEGSYWNFEYQNYLFYENVV